MSEWAQYLSDFMCNPTDENASYANNSKNYSLSAAIGGKDWSLGATVPAGTTWWGAACGAANGDTGVDTDAAWAKVYNADGPQNILQDDGSEKAEHILEYQTVCNAIGHDLKAKGPLPNGVWIGGQKHSIAQREVETGSNNEYSFISVLCMRKGEKGHWIICTDSSMKGKSCIVIAEFDNPAGCTAAMAKVVALDFAKWLYESGTDKADTICV